MFRNDRDVTRWYGLNPDDGLPYRLTPTRKENAMNPKSVTNLPLSHGDAWAVLRALEKSLDMAEVDPAGMFAPPPEDVGHLKWAHERLFKLLTAEDTLPLPKA